MSKLEKAPAPANGEAIELAPLLGKAVAVQVRRVRQVATKFGERPLAEVRIWVEDSSEPLDGVLFQSYFTKLPEGKIHAGIVRRDQLGSFSQWFLDSEKLTKKQVAALERLIETPTQDDVPF